MSPRKAATSPETAGDTGEVVSIQRAVIAEANAVLASNRKREPVVTMMADGTQRIDF